MIEALPSVHPPSVTRLTKDLPWRVKLGVPEALQGNAGTHDDGEGEASVGNHEREKGIGASACPVDGEH